MQKITHKIKDLADKEKEITREDILAIANDVLTELTDKEQIIKIEEISVITGNKITPTATVKLDINNQKKIGAGTGVGPVDAASNAIKSIIGPSIKLKEYNLKAITGGTDALADVTIKLADKKGNIFSAQALNEDVIMASVEALVKGVNKAMYFSNSHRKKYKAK